MRWLKSVSVGGIELDECVSCLGLWFDRDELNQVKDQMSEDSRWKDIDLWAYANRANFQSAGVNCPRCRSLMTKMAFDTSEITLEFCINCGGTWLDSGELQTILSYMRKQVSSEPLKALKEHAFQQFLEIFVTKKGVIEEMKDFVAAWRMLSLRFAIENPELIEKLRIIRSSIPF